MPGRLVEVIGKAGVHPVAPICFSILSGYFGRNFVAAFEERHDELAAALTLAEEDAEGNVVRERHDFAQNRLRKVRKAEVVGAVLD